MGRGPSDLQTEVLAADLCTGCGACLGHCPYLKTLGERVTFIHECPRTEGRCYAVCPRTGLNPDALDRQVSIEGRVTRVETVYGLLQAKSQAETAAAVRD